MKRLIGIIIAFVFIVSISVVDSVLCDKYINDTVEFSNEILQSVTQENFNNYQTKEKVDELEKRWTKYENFLCLMTHHNNIEDVGEHLVVMKTSQTSGDYQSFLSSLNLVIYYAKGYKHIFGVNLQNLI